MIGNLWDCMKAAKPYYEAYQKRKEAEMSETIKVGQVWQYGGHRYSVGPRLRTGPSGDGLYLMLKDGGGTAEESAYNVLKYWCFVSDAPAPTPTIEQMAINAGMAGHQPELHPAVPTDWQTFSAAAALEGAPKAAPREACTCKRCGLRFEAQAARERCDVCHEQQEKRMAAEAFASTHRALDVVAARRTRTYEDMTWQTRPPARIESDPYEAPATARGGMVGGIVRVR